MGPCMLPCNRCHVMDCTWYCTHTRLKEMPAHIYTTQASLPVVIYIIYTLTILWPQFIVMSPNQLTGSGIVRQQQLFIVVSSVYTLVLSRKLCISLICYQLLIHSYVLYTLGCSIFCKFFMCKNLQNIEHPSTHACQRTSLDQSQNATVLFCDTVRL